MKKGISYYTWPDSDTIKREGIETCFITGKTITIHEDAYWTWEFDAWISERGYQMIQNAQSTGEIEYNAEWQVIYGEWYAKDESMAGLQEMWHSEQMAKSNDDAGLYDDYDDWVGT